MITTEELNVLYRYAFAISQNEEVAFDLVQDSLLSSWTKSKKNKLAYLRTCIRNKYYDLKRKEKNHSLYVNSSKDLHSKDVYSDKMTSLESILINKDRLLQRLEKLEPIEREILFLWAYEGMSFKEMSHVLDIKIGTLLSKVNRIKLKFPDNSNTDDAKIEIKPAGQSTYPKENSHEKNSS